MARDVRTSPIGRLLIVAAALAALVVIFVALRPVFGGPQDRSFDVSAGQADAPELRVIEGDRVTIRMSSEKAVSVHLHGYDVVAEAAPGAPAVLSLLADKTGRFEIEDEDTEELLAVLIVEPR